MNVRFPYQFDGRGRTAQSRDDEHIRELGSRDEDRCVIFMKPPSCLVPPGGTIRMPRSCGRVDHEVELVAAVGKTAHGVSLDMYDHCETNAYKRVFGDGAYGIPVSAVKSMIGQSYSAGGLLGLSAALLALDRDIISPTVNLDEPDPICDLDCVPNRARMNDVGAALVVAISFGGTHSATIIRKAA